MTRGEPIPPGASPEVPRALQESELPWDDILDLAERVVRRQLGYEAPEEIENLVQEAMREFVVRFRMDPPSEWKGLLVTVTRSTAIDFLRRKIRWRVIMTSEPVDNLDAPDLLAPAPDSFEDPVSRVRFVVLHYFRSNANGATWPSGRVDRPPPFGSSGPVASTDCDRFFAPTQSSPLCESGAPMSEGANLRWLRSRLVAHEAGLLAPEEEERFTRLLGQDDQCRSLYETFRSASPEIEPDPEHLSPYKVARWDSIRRTLRGFERMVVQQHLEGCSECRDALVALGFEPFLEPEPETKRARGAGRQGVDTRRAMSLDYLREALSRLWTPQAGWIAATAAAVAVLLIRTPIEDSVVLRPVPVARVGSAVRGAPTEPVQVRISHDGRTIALAVQAPEGLSDTDSVHVRLTGPGGIEVATLATIVENVTTPEILLVESGGRMPEGRYSLEIETLDGGIARAYPFELPAKTRR